MYEPRSTPGRQLHDARGQPVLRRRAKSRVAKVSGQARLACASSQGQVTDVHDGLVLGARWAAREEQED